MSFWKTSEGQAATGEVQDNDFKPVPLSWYKSMFESVTVDEYEGVKKVSMKTRIIGDGPGKNRVLFLSLKCWDEDGKKRDRARNLATKISNILGVPQPESEPDDKYFSQWVDKPIDLYIDVWELDDGKSGNWLKNVEAKGTKAGGAAKVAPKAAAKPYMPPVEDGIDDSSIPF